MLRSPAWRRQAPWCPVCGPSSATDRAHRWGVHHGLILMGSQINSFIERIYFDILILQLIFSSFTLIYILQSCSARPVRSLPLEGKQTPMKPSWCSCLDGWRDASRRGERRDRTGFAFLFQISFLWRIWGLISPGWWRQWDGLFQAWVQALVALGSFVASNMGSNGLIL